MKNKSFSSEQQERITSPDDFHFFKKDDVENATLREIITVYKIKKFKQIKTAMNNLSSVVGDVASLHCRSKFRRPIKVPSLWIIEALSLTFDLSLIKEPYFWAKELHWGTTVLQWGRRNLRPPGKGTTSPVYPFIVFINLP